MFIMCKQYCMTHIGALSCPLVEMLITLKQHGIFWSKYASFCRKLPIWFPYIPSVTGYYLNYVHYECAHFGQYFSPLNLCLEFQVLSHDVASGSDITLCNKFNKPSGLQIYGKRNEVHYNVASRCQYLNDSRPKCDF